jgi:hypothetical protein
MNSRTLPRGVLHHLESLCLFAAMLLAVVLEGASVYCLASPSTFAFRPDSSRALAVEWTADKIPQYWFAGALAVLFYRVAIILRPPRSWNLSEVQQNRDAFLRLWRWTVAFGSLHVVALYLDRIGLGVR